MSLADELLADLEDLAGSEEEELVQEVVGDNKSTNGINNNNNSYYATLVNDIEELGNGNGTDAESDESKLEDLATLLGSEKMKNILANISKLPKERQGEVTGLIEEDPEYTLVIDANNLTIEIANEITIVHKFVRDIYHERFADLEQIVPETMSYIRVIHTIGNSLDISTFKLDDIIPSNIQMILSVNASTVKGKELSEKKLEKINKACNMAFELEDSIKLINEFVESRMAFISPNLSQIVGPSTAAKLMGAVGGITSLAKMPSCNVQVVGQVKGIKNGLSGVSNIPHCGFIYFCELVDPLPVEYKKKASKIIAAKAVLAARIDAAHQHSDGSKGIEMKQGIQKKIEKMLEPTQGKLEKALPRPDEARKNRRGGKRARKMKAKYAQTDVDKAMNRMKFGEIQENVLQTDLGFDLGMLGKGGSGRIRTSTIDSKTRVTITKRMQRELARQRAMGGVQTSISQQQGGSRGGSSTISGTSSSVVYSKDIGLEINNPNANEKISEIEGKYFSSKANFKNKRLKKQT